MAGAPLASDEPHTWTLAFADPAREAAFLDDYAREIRGFYRIALAANVPLALGCVDYARREAGILAYVTLSGDPAADIATIASHYAGHSGKRPELASPVRWLD